MIIITFKDANITKTNCVPACEIRHYPNYYVHEGFRQFYTSDIPKAIQIEDHAYVEPEVCELYTSLMLLAWVSQQNCSNIHNASIKRYKKKRDDESSKPISISSEQVFRAFVLNALLIDSAEEGKCLILPDLGDQDDRLKCAMEIRNRKLVTHGQKQRMHACGKCEKFMPGSGENGLRKFIFYFK